MDYQKLYDGLIGRAKNRTLEGYREAHHILPRCMGGDDSESNLVELTAREHYIAHIILVKMHPKQYGLAKAAMLMCFGYEERRMTNRLYDWLKKKHSIAMSISQSGEKNSQYGTRWAWIYKDKETKRVAFEMAEEYISNGWSRGIYTKARDIKQEKSKKNIKELEDRKTMLSEWYKIYNEVGFDKFKEITGYKFSKPNLVRIFSRQVDEFVPQNGKPRGR